MTDFNALSGRGLGFDRCEIGNNTPQLEDRANQAKETGVTPFDPSSEVAHVRQLAYDALHSDALGPSNQLWNEIQGLHQVPKLEAQVLQKLSEPDVTRRMPIARVDINSTGGITNIGFEPGCLDFDAKSPVVNFEISKPFKSQ